MQPLVKAIEGEQLYLRPYTKEEIPSLYEAFNNNQIARQFTGTSRIHTLEDIERYIEGADTHADVRLGIFMQGNDQLIGDTSFSDIDTPASRQARFQMVVFDDYIGQRFGTEATKLMLEYGFGKLNFHRIELEVFSFNTRAIHVYEKLGFVHEGMKRECRYYDHQYYHAVMMSILEQEYRKKHR